MGTERRMTKTVLALMAHPDDAEILCGGVLCLLRDRGWTIAVVTSTLGDCGSSSLAPREISAQRRREAREAAARLEGSHDDLGCRDLEVFYERRTIARAVEVLRRVRPDLVITHSPADYMLDHEETSRIARAACFNAPIPNAPSTGPGAPIAGIPHLYYADPVEGVDALGRSIEPGIVVDVDSVIEEKAELLACHRSQRDWLREHHGIDEYIDHMRRWTKARGRAAGFANGEGFRQHLGHAYPQDDLLAAELGALCRAPSMENRSPKGSTP
jgi:LmbE family N-acetylglucosaminyl deacetylase